MEHFSDIFQGLAQRGSNQLDRVKRAEGQDRSDRSRDDVRRSAMDVRETRYQAGDIFVGAVTFPIAKAGADTRSCRIVNPRKEFQISKE